MGHVPTDLRQKKVSLQLFQLFLQHWLSSFHMCRLLAVKLRDFTPKQAWTRGEVGNAGISAHFFSEQNMPIVQIEDHGAQDLDPVDLNP